MNKDRLCESINTRAQDRTVRPTRVRRPTEKRCWCCNKKNVQSMLNWRSFNMPGPVKTTKKTCWYLMKVMVYIFPFCKKIICHMSQRSDVFHQISFVTFLYEKNITFLKNPHTFSAANTEAYMCVIFICIHPCRRLIHILFQKKNIC